MPAACTLLLLLGLGLVPVPPAGSLPLASPRRLPPPPPPPPPSRNRLGRPPSPPAAGHAGSPVIESSHQERSSSTEMRTSGAALDSVELVTMLAVSRERASLPARHGAVPAASRVTGHTGPPASDGDVTPPGAGSPENPSAGTVTHLLTHSHPPDPGSYHHAAGRQGRGERALASPNTPGAAGGTPPGSEAISTDSAEGTQGRVWNVSGFNNTMRTVLLPSSSESHHPGTDSSSQPMSSGVGTELGSSPDMGTAAASPSPLGSNPSTSLPGSLGQPQASSRASSTQTGADHMMLHPRGVTGNSTSPLLTASPPMDNSFGAIGSSYQPSNNSTTERRGSDFPTTSTSVSTTGTKGGGRTLRSLTGSTRLVPMAEISSSGAEISSSSAQSGTPGMSVGAWGGGGRGVTDPLLTGSPSASESASTAFSSNSEPPESMRGAEEATLRSGPQGADMSSVAVGTGMSPANGPTAGVTRDSGSSTEPTSSLGGTSSSLATGTHHPKSSQEATDLPGPAGSPLLTSSLSASEGALRGVRSSQRAVAEKSSLSSSATKAPISATSSSSSSGRPPRSASGSSRWAAAEGSTSSSGVSRSLGTTRSLSTSAVRETSGAQGSTGRTGVTEVADSSLTHSRSPSEGPSPASGSSPVSLSILSTESRTNLPSSSSISVSTPSTVGGGGTSGSVAASTRLVPMAEISSSGTEISSSSAQSGTPGMSVGAWGGGGRGVTDPLLTGSLSASESASTAFSSNSEPPESMRGAEEATLRLGPQGADMSSVAVGTGMSPASGPTAGVTRDSGSSTEPTGSLGRTSSFLATGTHHPKRSREATDLPGPAGSPLLTSSMSASEGALRGVRSSQRAVAEKSSLSSSATKAPISATSSSSSGRPPRSASGSSRWAAAEGSTSSSGVSRSLGTTRSLSTSAVRETSGAQGSTGRTGVTEVADSSLTHSRSPSEGPSPATGSSPVLFSVLSTESRTNLPSSSSTLVSTPGTVGGGRTSGSVAASTTLAQTAEIATIGSENISSPGHSQSSLGAQGGGGRGSTLSSTNPLLTGSPSASESTSPAEKTSATGGRLPLTSTPGLVTATASEESSTVPMLDTRRASSATGSSAATPAHTSTLDTVLLLSSSAAEPGKQSNVSQSGAGLSELPTKLLPAFSPSISVPLPSATLFVHKEGTSQAPGSRSMWSTEAESLTSHPDTAGDTHTGPVLSSMAWPGVRHVSSGRAGSPEPKVTLSSRVFTYFSAAGEPSTIGSSHHSLSGSSAEERTSSPITDPVYSSTSVGGEERMLHAVTDGTLAGGMESSSFHAEASTSPGLSEPALVEQGRTANASTSSRGSTGFPTETVFPHSAKIPTYSSVQNDLTNSSDSLQPVSSIDGEKRTSVSHTDGTYISTTYTRGGERTLLSISNSSTSADSSESSTFFTEISSPFDASKSSVAHDRQTDASNSSSFVEPSTEPLLVHPSKLSTSASTGSIENTTLFNTGSELLTADRLSISSSAFPASSSLSSLQHSLSSTPPPTHLFTLSESSEPPSPSVMASSTPLQALSSSLPTSSLPSPSYSLASLLPVFSSPSSISQSSDSDQASATVVTSVGRQVPSTAAPAGSSPRETSKPSVTHQPQNSTTFTATRSPLPTAPMELLGGRVVSVSAPVTVTEAASPRDATTQGDSFGKVTPLLTTASVAPRAGPTDVPLSPSPSATNHSNIVPAVAVTTVKPPVLTTPASRRPTPGEASTVKDHRAQTPTATQHGYTTGKSTEAMDPTTAKPGKVTEENIPVTSPSEAPPATKTTVSIATTLAATKPTSVPPSSSTVGLRTSPPATEVDKCLSNPCPALATCNNTHGSYICQCPLGYELEQGKCNLARVFIGQVPLKLNITHGKYAELFHVEREILEVLNASLSSLPGYHHSTVKASREANFVHVSVQSTFSLASNVTFYDVISSVKSYIRACKSPTEACQFISSLKSLHRVGSLCRQKDPECDKETSECTDFDGVALCQCKSGYFKYNKMDHSCRACEDGYKLENETCVSCPFGLGGFNCGNPYQLITVVIAAAGGGLLLIMGIALIVTCCRKNKNDISKLIFKSGDFQLSPYPEYPKNPRAQEWGRETIEMQENGSTKNLLQMTDVYYSPTGLRNPELERNGLYPPYTGLPGSRHSCIYPGQYNPSFISDETRRRDYF